MKMSHLLVVVLFMCIPIACSAAVICPAGEKSQDCATDSYTWNKSTLTITKPGKYTFAHTDFPDEILIQVRASEVTLDGNGITIQRISGRDSLYLKNISIDIDNSRYEGYAISACRDIVNSSIVINSDRAVGGIEKLYGNVDDTNSITVTSQGDAHGVRELYNSGEISGGEFTVTSEQGWAHGVMFSFGTISGGEFTISTQDHDIGGVGVVYDSGEISGGTFTVTSAGQKDAGGVGTVLGIISGGEFTISSQGLATGVYALYGEISGGTFTVSSQEGNAYGNLQKPLKSTTQSSIHSPNGV